MIKLRSWDYTFKYARFEPNKIFPLISRGGKPIEIFGKKVSRNTLKLNCFKRKGLVCAGCGLEGKEFHLEYYLKEPNYWILNLYGFKNDRPILMTCDHIIPKAKGGKKDSIENVQPMCFDCNMEKGDSLDV